MESIYTDLALYGSKNYCARTDTVFYPISKVCSGTVSLLGVQICLKKRVYDIFKVISNLHIQLEI